MAYVAPAAVFNFTELQDMIVPDVWQKYIVQESTVRTSFWNSGILTDLTPVLGTLLGGGGTTVNMPFFNDLDFDGSTEEILDDTVDMSVDKISTSRDVATIIERAKAWGSTDLSADLSGADPLPVIAARFGAFWARQYQQILLSLCAGVFGAPSMQDNVLDITGLSGGAAVWDAESFIDAKYKLGDHASELTALAIHSDTAALMEKDDLIDYIRSSESGEQIATYQGKLVIVNDVMPKDANGNYVSYLFGPGAIGYAEGSVKVPVELYREPLRNMGRESLINRRKFAMHIRGVKWQGNATSGPTISNADIANSNNYVRVYDKKLIRMVAFKHKNR